MWYKPTAAARDKEANDEKNAKTAWMLGLNAKTKISSQVIFMMGTRLAFTILPWIYWIASVLQIKLNVLLWKT